MARQRDPLLALEDLRGLVLLDEIQRQPSFFRCSVPWPIGKPAEPARSSGACRSAPAPLRARWGLTSLGHSYILTNVVREVTTGSAAEGTCEVFVFDKERVEQAREALLPLETAQDVADVFKMLGHPTRVQILRALAGQELCVCDLAQLLGLSISATSYQLQTMRRAKLVRYRTEGKLAYYRVADGLVLSLLQDCLDHLVREGSDS